MLSTTYWNFYTKVLALEPTQKFLKQVVASISPKRTAQRSDRERFHTHPHTITQKHKLSTRKFQKDQDPQNFLAAHFVQCIGTGSQARITSSSLRRSKRRCQCPPLDRCPSRKKCCLSDSCNPYTARDSEQQSKPSTSERRSC